MANATRIAERAALIYDKLEGVIGSFNRAGESIDTAKLAFEEGMGRLATGRGNALSQAQQLTALGVKPKKSFSKVKVGTPVRVLADVIHPFPAFNRILGAVLGELAAKLI